MWHSGHLRATSACEPTAHAHTCEKPTHPPTYQRTNVNNEWLDGSSRRPIIYPFIAHGHVPQTTRTHGPQSPQKCIFIKAFPHAVRKNKWKETTKCCRHQQAAVPRHSAAQPTIVVCGEKEGNEKWRQEKRYHLTLLKGNTLQPPQPRME